MSTTSARAADLAPDDRTLEASVLEHPRPPLPPQPDGVAWPTERWPTGDLPPNVGIDDLIDAAMRPDGPIGATRAVVICHRGRLVAEHYGERTDEYGAVVGPPVTAEDPLISWSMAKSMLHAAVGILVGEDRLDLDAPVEVAGWDDERSTITLEHLLTMRDGLDFSEVYDPEGPTSDVIEMLFGTGASDVAGYATSRPARHTPDTVFNYSSGTSNVVADIVGNTLAPGAAPDERRDAVLGFLRDRLFEPVGMRSAAPRCDERGTWVASSYVWATALDMARFGMLYLRDGVWDGVRILPQGWVDHARRARSLDETDGRLYGAHWWVAGDDLGTFWANGFQGQSIVICPTLDLLVVRLGKSRPEHSGPLGDWRMAVVDRFRNA